MTVHALLKTAAIGTAVATVASLALLGPTTHGHRGRAGTEQRGQGHRRVPLQRPRAGHDHAGLDLLHALQPGRRRAPTTRCRWSSTAMAGAAAARATRRLHAVARRRLRRAELRPARLRRERRHGPRRAPDFEGQDVRRLVDLVAGSTGWQEARATPARRHRRLYGGGYQFVGAFTELRVGQPGFDALAPEITWWDLKESLAPAGGRAHRVGARAERGPLPSRGPAAGLQGARRGRRDRQLARRLIPGTETSTTFFGKNGPAWHVSRAAGSTSPCCSARARPTTCSTSTGSRELAHAPHRGRPQPASSSRTTAATRCRPSARGHRHRLTRAGSRSPAATSTT